MYHRDPFDRILIAQSLEEKMPILTSDPLYTEDLNHGQQYGTVMVRNPFLEPETAS